MEVLEKRTLCIDIDQTICRSNGPGSYADATPIEGASEHIADLRAQGWLIIFFTARHFNNWKVTTDWLAKYGFEYDQIVFGKPPARYYIDDRAIRFDGDWQTTIKRIEDLSSVP